MLTVDRNRVASPRFALPQSCCWCDEENTRGPVCNSCRARLPWNEPACRACAIPLPSANGVCAECLEGSPPQDRSWAAFRYESAIAGQIIGLKFHARFAPAHVLGVLMAQRLAQRPEPLPELLIPVPLHPRRLRLRGYNQALEIGREISGRLGIPLAPQGAQRVRMTHEQTRLSAVERRRNVRGVFEVSHLVRGRHIALLDDVITTGATAGELARVARRAGARRIEVWAAARAPLPGSMPGSSMPP